MPPQERIPALDVLRGVAVLGILPVNIVAFGLPQAAALDPEVLGPSSRAGFAAWVVTHLFFEMKFMTIFSALYGAGMVLLADRMEARGSEAGPTFYRRSLWLLVFGLLHAYLLWYGDILFTYAVCGMLVFLARRLPPGLLVGLGLAVVMLAAANLFAMGLASRAMGEATLDPSGSSAHIAAEIAAHRGGYWTALQQRVPEAIAMQTIVLLFFSGPRAAGLMLVGMGLLRMRILGGGRSRRFYLLLAIVGYGVGLPVVALGAQEMILHQFSTTWWLQSGVQYNYTGSLLVALGHTGLVLWACQAGLLRWLQGCLSAAGRMAFTCYLTQTAICMALFDGWGLGLFAHLDRVALAGIVVAIWLLQLAACPLWLAHFRFGPAEWLWRSLTYSRRQPMRAPPAGGAAALPTPGPGPASAGPGQEAGSAGGSEGPPAGGESDTSRERR